MGTKQTTSRFALMQHVPSGEAYAIEYADETDGRIVGIIGPLHYSQVRDSLGVVFPETSHHWLELQDAFDGADALEDVDWAATQQWELVTLIRAREKADDARQFRRDSGAFERAVYAAPPEITEEGYPR